MIKKSSFFIIWTVFIFSKGSCQWNALPPSQLSVELLEQPEKVFITDFSPEFGWVMNSNRKNDYQTAYQILVASSQGSLANNNGDWWDSGKVSLNHSINVEYAGKLLSPHSTYFWQVRTWDKENNVSDYSQPQMFRTGVREEKYGTVRYPLEKYEIAPLKIIQKDKGHYFIDFGKAAFGTIKFEAEHILLPQQMEIHLGETISAKNTIERNPKGAIRYRKMMVDLEKGNNTYVISIPPDKRNTGEQAVKMPDDIGEVMPFRYSELVNCPFKLTKDKAKQIAVIYPFNDSTTTFISNNKILNDVWEFCKYSIKATSFCGVYVDGDRERLPYEADAYINQLSHYHVDREFSLARYSYEYLINHPTWPTEWIMHSVLMAWADYLYTGNKESLENYDDDLKAKALIALEREDGLISTRTGLVTDEVLEAIHFQGELKDIVDWPPGSFTNDGAGERDGYEMGDINTVVNAFHYQTLTIMTKIAAVLHKNNEVKFFRLRAELVKRSINEKLFDKKRRIYVDGENIDHASLHANMFPLAFDLVPDENIKSVVEFIKSRKMACSVYGAQYLLEALYKVGEDEYALWLMTNDSDRSWPHMIYEVGTTITQEAWDWKYKNNLDWNHAWGSAPANIIPRYVMGIQPLEPGFGRFQIKPQVGDLKEGRLDLATIRGTIHVDFKTNHKTFFKLKVRIPANTSAKVLLPKLGTVDKAKLKVNGAPVQCLVKDNYLVVNGVGSGEYEFVTKRK